MDFEAKRLLINALMGVAHNHGLLPVSRKIHLSSPAGLTPDEQVAGMALWLARQISTGTIVPEEVYLTTVEAPRETE